VGTGERFWKLGMATPVWIIWYVRREEGEGWGYGILFSIQIIPCRRGDNGNGMN
jgi:hypothetical protein